MEKTRITRFRTFPNPCSWPPKPTISAQNGQKEEKFTRAEQEPTVKRVVLTPARDRLSHPWV